VLRPSRLVALAGLALLAILYWNPLHSYVTTKQQLNRRQADVSVLEAQKRQLERRIARVDSGEALVREARRLGLVKPGERLFIVRGISAWRRSH
jgi:cell division protein FtsB